MRAAPDLSVYLVTDEGQCRSRGRDVLATVEAAVDGESPASSCAPRVPTADPS